MTEDITSLPSTASVLDAAKFMTDMNVGTVIVTHEDVPSGMITDRDVVAKVLAQDKDSKTTRIEEIMVAPVVTISEDRDIVDATQVMSSHGIRRLPVTDPQGKLAGVISLDDVLLVLGKEMQNVAGILKKELEKE
jgi:CBS domain-containing protein